MMTMDIAPEPKLLPYIPNPLPIKIRSLPSPKVPCPANHSRSMVNGQVSEKLMVDPGALASYAGYNSSCRVSSVAARHVGSIIDIYV
jgi:hypothetical protein